MAVGQNSGAMTIPKAAEADSPFVRTTSSAYMLQRLHLIRTLQGGTPAMRKAGEIYLPMHPKESYEHYRRRLDSTFLHNVYERAVCNMADKPFSEPTTVDGDVRLKEWSQDIDLRGNDITSFGRNFLRDALRTGIGLILVDFPRVPHGISLAEERKLGARPYFVPIRLENVLAINVTVVDGRKVVTHLRVLTQSKVRDGYSERIQQSVKIYEPGFYQEWVQDSLTGQFSVIDEGSMTLGEVPLAIAFYGEEEDDFVVKPPFEDLAWKNIEHWQSSSDQRNILRYGRFPMLAAKGFKPQLDKDGKPVPLEVGPSKVLTTPEGGEFYYVEPEGNAIAAGEKDLARLEEEMAFLSLRPKIQNSYTVTATAAAIDEVDETNTVKAITAMTQDCFEQALIFAGMWVGTDYSSATVILNGGFEISSDRGQSIDTVLRLLDAGKLSDETVLTELKALGVFRSRFDVKEELKKLHPPDPSHKPTSEGMKTGLPGNIPSNVSTAQRGKSALSTGS